MTPAGFFIFTWVSLCSGIALNLNLFSLLPQTADFLNFIFYLEQCFAIIFCFCRKLLLSP